MDEVKERHVDFNYYFWNDDNLPELPENLKKIYVDSALRKAEKLNASTGTVEPEYKGPQVEISWKQFKMLNSKNTR